MKRRIEPTWGGWRPGAGRPRKPGAEQKVPRERFFEPTVVRVTTTVLPELRSLRSGKLSEAVTEALHAGAHIAGFAVVHYSIQAKQLHMIVEASEYRRLSAGMRQLKVRLARAVNRAIGRSGTVFLQRYEAELLQTPTEVRNGLQYVLNNNRMHRQRESGWIDPLSSACWFDGFSDREPDEDYEYDNPLPEARTEMLTQSWRRGRGGLISVDEVPEPRPEWG